MSNSPVREMTYDQLDVRVYSTNKQMGRAASEEAAAILRQAIAERGVANVVLAAANSQLTFLHALREMRDIHWQAVQILHMDEYLDLPPGHAGRYRGPHPFLPLRPRR